MLRSMQACWAALLPFATVMRKTPGIQIADMLAWEVLQVTKHVSREGEIPDPRAHFRQLVELKWMDINWIGPAQIRELVRLATRPIPSSEGPAS